MHVHLLTEGNAYAFKAHMLPSLGKINPTLCFVIILNLCLFVSYIGVEVENCLRICWFGTFWMLYHPALWCLRPPSSSSLESLGSGNSKLGTAFPICTWWVFSYKSAILVFKEWLNACLCGLRMHCEVFLVVTLARDWATCCPSCHLWTQCICTVHKQSQLMLQGCSVFWSLCSNRLGIWRLVPGNIMVLNFDSCFIAEWIKFFLFLIFYIFLLFFQ